MCCIRTSLQQKYILKWDGPNISYLLLLSLGLGVGESICTLVVGVLCVRGQSALFFSHHLGLL
jgi:hypothetical protein